MPRHRRNSGGRHRAAADSKKPTRLPPREGAPAIGELLEVRIEKLAVGGAGVARKDGFVLFVPDAAPGDLLEIEVVEHHRNHGEARIRRILESGPGRRTPPCRYAGECGGCGWQHLKEETQLAQKQLLVEEILRKFLPDLHIPMDPIVPSPRALRYRNRVQPVRKTGRLGYRKRRSHEILAVDDCLIAEEPLTPFFVKPPPGPEGSRVELRLSPDGTVVCFESGDEDGFAFSQVNRFQNDELVADAVAWASQRPVSAIWDLYAGSGNFTFPLAEAFPDRPVIGVELSSALVRRAREENLGRSREQLEFFLSDVTTWLHRRLPPPGSLVLLDPPRAGAGPEVMRSLAASDATSILYVACHPVSLARDLATFFSVETGKRWKLRQVRAYEMFPQTDHVETIAHLVVDSTEDDATFSGCGGSSLSP